MRAHAAGWPSANARAGQVADAHHVHAGVVVAEVRSPGQLQQHLLVGPRDLAQGLVALVVHLAQVHDDALHLRRGGRIEAVRGIAIRSQARDSPVNNRHAGAQSWAMQLMSCSGLKGLTR